MPDYSPRLNIPKPQGSENVTRALHNAMVDAIDAAAAKKTDVDAHTTRVDNPHSVTAAQVGAIPTTQRGAVNGVATLDASGNVPLSQLGSYRNSVANDVQITGITAQNIVTYTPTAPGNFIVYVYFRVITAATTVTVNVNYTDASGAQTSTIVNATSYATGSYHLVPVFLNATAAAITVQVTAGTANQVYVSSSIIGA